jgi:hypothetical protein
MGKLKWPRLSLTAALATAASAMLSIGVALALLTSSPAVGSNDFNADTLDPPTGLTATGGASITLNWTATPDTYAGGHRVLRGTTTGGPYTQIAEVTPRTTVTYNDAPAAGTYYYVVRAYYQSWESANSNEASATKTGAAAMRVATGTYTGSGIDNRAFTGLGFQPDIVMIKISTATSGVIRTSTMVGDASKPLTLVGALAPNLVQSLDADGFTVGTDTRVNASASTYYWVAMKAGAELKLGTYVGNGADNRSITGVGFQPDWLITLGDGDDSVFRPGTIAGDASFLTDGSSALVNHIQAMEADGFQIGTNIKVNETGTTFHYVAWDVSANVKQTTYAGNGTDNRSIGGVGFQPLMAWVKRDSLNQSTWRPASTAGDLSHHWGAAASAVDRIQALELDGFQVGTSPLVNSGTGTYHYIAFKDGGP